MCTAVGLHGALKSADSSMLLFGNVLETLSPGGGTLLQPPAGHRILKTSHFEHASARAAGVCAWS